MGLGYINTGLLVIACLMVSNAVRQDAIHANGVFLLVSVAIGETIELKGK